MLVGNKVYPSDCVPVWKAESVVSFSCREESMAVDWGVSKMILFIYKESRTISFPENRIGIITKGFPAFSCHPHSASTSPSNFLNVFPFYSHYQDFSSCLDVIFLDASVLFPSAFSFPGVIVAHPVKNISQETPLLIPEQTWICFLGGAGDMSAVWFCVWPSWTFRLDKRVVFTLVVCTEIYLSS